MTEMRLRVDWTHCEGRGVCADLVPELITMDEWGYPVVSPDPVKRRLLPHARLAVSSCPMLALHVQPVARARRARASGRSSGKPSAHR